MPLCTQGETNLIKRYLLWCYKTTKEELDRIDRKFTQLKVDDYLLQELTSGRKTIQKKGQKEYLTAIKDFEKYIAEKKKGTFDLKYSDPKGEVLNPKYLYLKNRLSAIEKAICHFLGTKDLQVIKSLYEEEMIRRIIQSQEHR